MSPGPVSDSAEAPMPDISPRVHPDAVGSARSSQPILLDRKCWMCAATGKFYGQGPFKLGNPCSECQQS